MVRVVDAIIGAKPKGVSFGGGEPLLAPWWAEAIQRFDAAGIPVVVSTSGWMMDEESANTLSRYAHEVVVSIDGATEQTNDFVRGRQGAFGKAMETLECLLRVKRERAARGERHARVGVDYTVVRRGRDEVEKFVVDMTTRFPELDHITFGAAVPCGLAEEESFAGELLSEDDLDTLAASHQRLVELSKSPTTEINVADVRLFRPDSPLHEMGDTHAHLEPDGQLRAFATNEKKVGSILEVPVDELWRRALEWRNSPFVSELRCSIRNTEDWARVNRTLDQHFGSENDLVRIAKRGDKKAARPQA
ncbi:MAG: hypothetical protein Tsb0020_21140 [Haliangiales bacterium]